MDSQAWMTTMHTQRWSLSNFPIGIGLAAAAHVHMRNRIRSMADQQERGHLLRKSIITLDQVLATLEDLRDIDNAINMLDRAIEELEDRHWEARSDDQAKHSASRRRRRRHRQRVARERDQLAHAGSVANSVMTEVENGFRIELSPLPRFPEEGAFWTTESEDEYGSHQDAYRTPGHSQSETSRNRHAASESGAAQRSAPDLTRWSTTCQELRGSRNASIEKTIRQVAAFEPLLIGLDKSYSSALCWSVGAGIRFAVTTKPISNVIARVIAASQRIMARLSFWTDDTGTTSTSSGASDIATRLQLSTAFLFLPLVPTLLVCGMHFMVAVKARWLMFRIQRTYRESMLLAKKHSVASTLLSIRQQRLEWLRKEIEIFEREEQEEQHGAPMGLRANPRENPHENDESDQVNDRTTTTATTTAATTATVNNNNNNNNRYQQTADRRFQLAIEQFNNSVAASLRTSSVANNSSGRSAQQPRSSTAQSDQRSPRTPANAPPSTLSPNINTSSSGDRSGRHYILKNPGIQMLGPDLYTMDLEAFLRNRHERRRILRLEAKAMRSDLRLMRQQVLDQSKRAIAQA